MSYGMFVLFLASRLATWSLSLHNMSRFCAITLISNTLDVFDSVKEFIQGLPVKFQGVAGMQYPKCIPQHHYRQDVVQAEVAGLALVAQMHITYSSQALYDPDPLII